MISIGIVIESHPCCWVRWAAIWICWCPAEARLSVYYICELEESGVFHFSSFKWPLLPSISSTLGNHNNFHECVFLINVAGNWCTKVSVFTLLICGYPSKCGYWIMRGVLTICSAVDAWPHILWSLCCLPRLRWWFHCGVRDDDYRRKCGDKWALIKHKPTTIYVDCK